MNSQELKRLLDIAKSHSYSDGFNGMFTKYRIQHIEELRRGDEQQVLDLGCGEGGITSYLSEAFPSVTGVEASSAYLDIAKKSAPKAHFFQALAEEFDTTANTFDMILMSGLLEHIESPVELLRRARKWLKDSGYIIVIVPNALSLHRLVGVEAGFLKNCYQLNDLDIAVGHRRVYDAPLLHSHLQAAGWEVTNAEGIFLKPLSNSQMEKLADSTLDAFHSIGKLFPDNCAEICIQARKMS